jgi:crossover junction endodeoxyribonuclease RuvC
MLRVLELCPVLGVDPGLKRTGYALLDWHRGRPRVLEAGVVRLEAQATLERRLLELEDALAGLVRSHRPDCLACEELYAHYRHPRTAILMAHARGVILALAARHHLSVMHLAATHVKKLLTGNGAAGKVQMQRAVCATLGLARPPEPHDVADAIAVALCALHLRRARAPAPRQTAAAGARS